MASLSAALDMLPTTTTSFLFSSEHHPAPHSSTTCTGGNGENTKALKVECAMSEDARKRDMHPTPVRISSPVINSLLPPAGIAWSQFQAQTDEIDGQC